MDSLLPIDGNQGGGQILRSALALSMVTGRGFHITDIRGRRRRPGLLRQHLTCVRAAAALCGAEVEQATLGSTALRFRPGALTGGELDIAVGSAGSAMLVLQAVAPALLCAPEPTTLQLSGGTHNPAAPSFAFVARSWAPALAEMGARIESRLDRHGFFPAGGGRARFVVAPWSSPRAFVATQAPREVRLSAEILVSQLPKHVGNTERESILEELGTELPDPPDVRIRRIRDSPGPGNVVSLRATDATGRCVQFVDHGRKGRPSREVVGQVVERWRRWRDGGVPIDEHLADQLLLPMALGAGGRFLTTTPTAHTRTNAALIQRFVDATIELREKPGGRCLVVVRS